MVQLPFKSALHSVLVLATLAVFTGQAGEPVEHYEPTWNSLCTRQTPQWLRDGKFGIYTHWGVYSVPAQGPNATWYSHNLYMKENGPERKFHEATYGPLQKFGYKDFIPMFTGEKFASLAETVGIFWFWKPSEVMI